MDTKELERFCPWARQELVDAVYRGMVQLGVDEASREQYPAGSEALAGHALSPAERERRDALIAAAEAAGDAAFAEREAYSWFNRLMALRYMELHGLLPWGGRALSAADGSFSPMLTTHAADLPLSHLDRAAYLDCAAASDDSGAFRLALEAACAELAPALPGVFEGASCDLLPKGFINPGEHNVIQHLVEDVPEAAWGDVEALGWAYQFYNSKRKDEFFKSKRKAAAEDIAPATQLFTPDWIVRYMVQNSLGRLWMLNNPDSPLKQQMEFYIEPDAVHEDFLRVAGPEEITFCDPACGSGHILAYAFRLLTEMYRERGWRDRDIARSILEKNLSGYEVDPRAAQIAQTALCMEAIGLDRRWLSRGVTANVRVLESIQIDRTALDPASALRERPQLLDALEHLGEIGSLFKPSPDDMGALKDEFMRTLSGDLFVSKAQDGVKGAHDVCEALSRRFDVVVANPPYMGSSSFNPFVAKWIKKNYPDSCRDLCTAFIERGYGLAAERGYAAMVTMQSWMFLGSFEKMRERMIERTGIVSMAHIGPRAFDAIGGEVVNVTATVLYNAPLAGEGSYIRLMDVAGSEPKRAALLEAVRNPNCGWFYRADASTFQDIPGSPIAYWASEAMRKAFLESQALDEIAQPKQGLATSDDKRFIRMWWEVNHNSIGFAIKSREEASRSLKTWFPCVKGGGFRKWSGGSDSLVNWKNDGQDMKNTVLKKYPYLKTPDFVLKNQKEYFNPGITWGFVSSSRFSMRNVETGFIPTVAGSMCFPGTHSTSLLLLGLMNSSIVNELFGLIAPTLNFTGGDVGKIPVKMPGLQESEVIQTRVESLTKASQLDWNEQEISWGFKRNSLV